VIDLNHIHEPEERAGQFPPLDGTQPRFGWIARIATYGEPRRATQRDRDDTQVPPHAALPFCSPLSGEEVEMAGRRGGTGMVLMRAAMDGSGGRSPRSAWTPRPLIRLGDSSLCKAMPAGAPGSSMKEGRGGACRLADECRRVGEAPALDLVHEGVRRVLTPPSWRSATRSSRRPSSSLAGSVRARPSDRRSSRRATPGPRSCSDRPRQRTRTSPRARASGASIPHISCAPGRRAHDVVGSVPAAGARPSGAARACARPGCPWAHRGKCTVRCPSRWKGQAARTARIAPSNSSSVSAVFGPRFPPSVATSPPRRRRRSSAARAAPRR